MLSKYDIHPADIIWADPRYPDQPEAKVRPLIVISQDVFHQNSNYVVCVGTTTSKQTDPYLLPLSRKDQLDIQLEPDMQVMCKRLASLRCDLIKKKVGKITKEFFARVLHKVTNDILEPLTYTDMFSGSQSGTSTGI